MRQKLFGLIFILIMIVGLSSGLTIKPASAASLQLTEWQVTTSTASQQNPDVCGDVIVWQDSRNGNWDIYIYAARLNGWQPELQITNSSGNEICPKISNNIIVYQSDRNGNWDIYSYNLTSKTETQITNNTAIQQSPAISGNIIIWQDARNGVWNNHGELSRWDIYKYNLTSQTEERVPLSWSNYCPSIDGNRIAYVKDQTITSRDGSHWVNPYIYSYDFTTGGEVQIAAGDAYDMPTLTSTSVAGTHVAWASFYAPIYDLSINDWSVTVKDAATSSSWSSWGGNQEVVDISGEWPYMYAVLTDDHMGNWEIYMHEFGSGTDDRITNNSAVQTNPAVFSGRGPDGWLYNRIVYMDYRNGNWDIYATDFGWAGAGGPGPTPPPLTPGLVIKNLEQLKTDYADASMIVTGDFSGANDKVRENRRNAIINQLYSAINLIEAAANTGNLQQRAEYCQSAIDQLTEIQNKTDGYTLRNGPDAVGSGYTPDWIVGFTAQLYLYQVTGECIEDLQTLLENIA